MKDRSKIVFVLSNVAVNGGNRVIAEYAKRLQQRGHEITLIWPLVPPYPLSQAVNKLKDGSLHSSASKLFTQFSDGNEQNIWSGIEETLIQVPFLNSYFIENALESPDVIIATDPRKTPEAVAGLDFPRARQIHFAQGYGGRYDGEIEAGLRSEPSRKMESIMQRNFSRDLDKVVISDWVKEVIENKFDQEVEAVIPNGIDLEKFQYKPNSPYNTSKPMVLAPYRNGKRKGMPEAIEVYRHLNESETDVELAMFGPTGSAPDWINFYNGLSDSELVDLYSATDIFMLPSRHEAFGLPPMEAMACKSAVVSTDVGAVSNYSIPGETVRLVPPKRADRLEEEITELLNDPEERTQMAEAAHSHIQQYSWETATDRFEAVVTA